MANPIIRIKRGSTTPANGVLSAGELAVDLTNKNLFVGQADGSALTIGGEGTFATKAYTDSAITAATGSLGTMSTQDADAVAIIGGAIDGTTIGATTASSGAFTTLTASSAPTSDTDVVRKLELDSAISALGSAFEYVGTVDGGADAANATDLTALSKTQSGDYYKVAVAGHFNDGTTTFFANVNDGIVFNTTGGADLIDNTNSTVAGTANEIAVTGSADTGYTVAVDSAFSTRVSTSETKTQNIDPAETTAGTTKINDRVVVGMASGMPELIVQGLMEPEILKVSGESVTIAGSANPAGALIVNGQTALNGGVNVTGDVAVTGNISATGTVGGTNITDLESKTQNINLADTSPNKTSVQGHIALNGFDINGVLSGVGLGADSLNNSFIRVESSADTIFKADANGVVLGGQYAGASPSTLNIECRHNLVGVDDPNNSTMMNIENFVIDGGTF